MTPKIEIRLAHDQPSVVLDLFQEYIEMLCQRDASFRDYLALQNYEEETRDLSTKYGLPKGRLYVAYCDGQAAGCIALRPMAEMTCEMKRLYVRPAFRGLGLAGKLVDRIIKEARQIGYGFMVLDTLACLEGAIRLYEKFGFQPIPSYNDNPMAEAIYMKLNL